MSDRDITPPPECAPNTDAIEDREILRRFSEQLLPDWQREQFRTYLEDVREEAEDHAFMATFYHDDFRLLSDYDMYCTIGCVGAKIYYYRSPEVSLFFFKFPSRDP